VPPTQPPGSPGPHASWEEVYIHLRGSATMGSGNTEFGDCVTTFEKYNRKIIDNATEVRNASNNERVPSIQIESRINRQKKGLWSYQCRPG
jgi:hypothetical protein